MKRQALGRSRLVLTLVGAVALVGAAACAAKVERQEDVAAQQAKAERQWSPVKVVIDAARVHGNLSIAQEDTLDAIEVELDANHESCAAMREKFRGTAAAMVRSGTVDQEEFDRNVAEAVKLIEERIQQTNDALEEIHAILEPEQREAVADALHDYVDSKFGPKPELEERHPRGFKRFASELMLSALQVKQLMAIKKELIGNKRELRPSAEELHAMIDAFAGNDFSTALADFHAKKRRILLDRVTHASERADTVLSIFTPEQRDLLADLILEGPSKVLLGETEPQP